MPQIDRIAAKPVYGSAPLKEFRYTSFGVIFLPPNFVTLYRTLETSSLLLLLLEYIPSEDLLYFLEARDHYEMNPSSSESSCTSRTPPTHSLLSSLDPDQLLSRTRSRLIASMFSQMYEAVGRCHNSDRFNRSRDLKPENLIVIDGGWTT